MIVGIDLGTTNSLVGAWKAGKSELIPNALGSFLTPSARTHENLSLKEIRERLRDLRADGMRLEP